MSSRGLDIITLSFVPLPMLVILLCAVAITAYFFYRAIIRLKHVNLELMQSLDSQSRLLVEKNSQLNWLKHLSETLISQVDIKPAFDLALEMATDVIGARTASIMMFDVTHTELSIAAARGLPEDVVQNTRLKVGEGLAGLVAAEGKAIVINSDSLDERLAPLALRKDEVRSAIIAPIKVDGEVRGVINVSDKRNCECWEEEDLAVISTLAIQTAMFLQKVDLYASLQEQVVILRDTLQELQQTQAGLIQSEKLASIGQLAGGVAHEINNPLHVILGRAEFAFEKLEENSPAIKDLEIIRTQIERIAEIVRNLLDFSRTNRADDFRAVNANDVIEKTLVLTEAQMQKRNIEVVRELSNDLPAIWGNPGQIQQVFVNIVINASQAMAKLGGVLTISTWMEDEMAFARFSDTGPGIPLEDREQIFEPFYTTKSETEGTGLGLAISRGIIHTHGGSIEVSGEPGKGAIFTISLPPANTDELLEKKESNGQDEQEKHNGRGRRERDPRAVSRHA